MHINDRSYDINCGSGLQDLSWLAMTASYLYSKEVYPKGFYQPTLLMHSGDRVPHPRRRISAALNNVHEVTVILKDPSQPQSSKQLKWYKKALGESRNIMKFTIEYKPRNYDFSTGNRINASIVVKVNYIMFKELEQEFDVNLFPQNFEIELKSTDASRKNFKASIYLPFGEIKKKRLFETLNYQKDMSDSPELKELSPDEQSLIDCTLVPEPWSKKQQKEAIILEEQENKKHEEEAVRKAQEQMQRIESNPAIPVKTLYDVWPDAPSAFAPHFPLLFDIFSIYANYHLPEENMISAHDFFHFLRAFELVNDIDDMIQIIIELGDDIEAARNEVLKAKINISHFLGLLVKFAEIRNPEDTGFNILIETMSKIKAIWLQDYTKAEMLKPEISELFMENCEDLTLKYLSKATRVEGVMVDLKIADFIAMVLECEALVGLTSYEKVKQISEDTLFFSSFKDSQMLYADFLENLVRLTQTIPFNEDEITQNFENQSETVILAEKLNSIIKILCGGKPPASAGSRGISRGKS